MKNIHIKVQVTPGQFKMLGAVARDSGLKTPRAYLEGMCQGYWDNDAYDEMCNRHKQIEDRNKKKS